MKLTKVQSLIHALLLQLEEILARGFTRLFGRISKTVKFLLWEFSHAASTLITICNINAHGYLSLQIGVICVNLTSLLWLKEMLTRGFTRLPGRISTQKKVKFLLWALSHSCLNTYHHLQHYCSWLPISSNWCHLCDSQNEMQAHTFYHLPFYNQTLEFSSYSLCKAGGLPK